jgi:hypothetical protein
MEASSNSDWSLHIRKCYSGPSKEFSKEPHESHTEVREAENAKMLFMLSIVSSLTFGEVIP